MTTDDLEPEFVPTKPRLRIKGSTEELRSLVTKAAKTAPLSETIPGTGNILLTAKAGGQVSVEATDGIRYVVSKTDSLKVLTPGRVLLPPRRLAAILALAKDEETSISVLGGNAAVISGNSKWVVKTTPGEELPYGHPDATSVLTAKSVPAKAFKEALGRVLVAASTSPARPALMQVSIEKGKITALDGGRVHQRKVKKLDKSIKCAMPVATASTLMSLLTSDVKEFGIASTGRSLDIRTDNDILISSTLISPFPAIDSQFVQPAMANKNTLTVNVAALKNAVTNVSVSADKDYRSITLTSEGNTLSVRAKDREGNAALEEIAATFEGPTGQHVWTVNYKHLLDFLNLGDGETVTWKVGEGTTNAPSPLLLDDGVSMGVLHQVRDIRQK